MSLSEYPKTEEVKSEPQKNTEQKTISYTPEDVVIMPNTLEAVIISIEKKYASEIFGEKNLRGNDRHVLHITYENAEYGISNHDTVGWFPQGKVPDRSKLAKFIKRYGKLEEGVKITLIKNAEGFYKMLYE